MDTNSSTNTAPSNNSVVVIDGKLFEYRALGYPWNSVRGKKVIGTADDVHSTGHLVYEDFHMEAKVEGKVRLVPKGWEYADDQQAKAFYQMRKDLDAIGPRY